MSDNDCRNSDLPSFENLKETEGKNQNDDCCDRRPSAAGPIDLGSAASGGNVESNAKQQNSGQPIQQSFHQQPTFDNNQNQGYVPPGSNYQPVNTGQVFSGHQSPPQSMHGQPGQSQQYTNNPHPQSMHPQNGQYNPVHPHPGPFPPQPYTNHPPMHNTNHPPMHNTNQPTPMYNNNHPPMYNNPGVYSPNHHSSTNFHTTSVVVNSAPQPKTQIIAISANNVPNVCGNPIPQLDPSTALVILIINIFFPGIGTMVVGCVGRDVNGVGWFFIGFLQLILVFCFIGWIWAIMTGIQVLQIANQPRTVTLLQG